MLYAPSATFAVSIFSLKLSWRGEKELGFTSNFGLEGSGNGASGTLKVSVVRGQLLTTASSQFTQQSSQ